MQSVTVRSLTKRYGETAAIDDVSFTVQEGTITTLLGPSGSGKTTTLRCVAGLEDHDGGEIYIGERLVSVGGRGTLVPPADRSTGMVFQSYAIWPHMTVAENVAFGLRVRRASRDAIDQKVRAALRLVQLEHRASDYPSQLSGGQQQRVVLARSLAYDPELLLLDEPLANLDAKLREQMRFELKEIQRRTGITALYVTHDQGEAMVLSDQLIVMNHGKIEQTGGAEEIYEHPRTRFVAGFVGASNFVSATRVEPNGAGYWATTTSLGRVLVTGTVANAVADLQLAFRPEDVEIDPVDRHGVQNAWPGMTLRRIFLGDLVRYVVQVGDVEIQAQLPRRVRIAENQRVTVHVAPEHLSLVSA
jgi:ABC-type Fe3+/spermidine/putrescine transport system ATPase subunit